MRSRLLGLTVATVIRFGEGGCQSTKVTISGLREEKRGREEGRVHERASSEVSSRRREERKGKSRFNTSNAVSLSKQT